MINSANDPTDAIDDVDPVLCDEANPDGAFEGGVGSGSEFEGGQESNELPLTLEASIVNGEDCVEIYAHGEVFSSGRIAKRVVLLARVSARQLTMFPLEVDANRGSFLGPKYGQLSSITVVAQRYRPWPLPESIRDFDELLEELPTGFSRHAVYGLGLRWEYRLVPEAIVKMSGVTELIIEPGDGASAELSAFKLGVDRFTKIRKAIDTISKRASAQSLIDRRLVAYNETLHAARPDEFEYRYPDAKANEIYKLIQLRGRASNRSAKDGIAAAQVVREDARKIASEEPAKLLELKAVIERVTLSQLIDEFNSMLQKNLAESKWQSFFKANPFILGLAFPYPVILFQDQASVGGTTIRGNGERIVDFLMAQRFTGNLALIEIKRPSSDLVNSRVYRGDMHAPHWQLTESMAQVLDQRAQLLHHFSVRKSDDKKLADVHVTSVNCIVVIGDATEEYRANSLTGSLLNRPDF